MNAQHVAEAKEIILLCATLLRPIPIMLPSEFAEKYRVLKEGTTERPGPWSNDHFPYLVPIMDAVSEAIRSGRNLALMKSAQGGGSEAIINACCWLLTYFPGPLLYLISKEPLAKTFGLERIEPIVETCEPLRRKLVTGRGSGESIQNKVFADGKWVLQGGRSVLNLQTLPYRIVVIDEYDSMLDEIEGHGDPLKLAEQRTGAFSGRTIVIVFAHPTTRDRGAGKVYYEQSDQRRAQVTCPHCGGNFWLQWSHVRVVPGPGMSQDQAKNDPRCYAYYAPCCGAHITDAQRWEMSRHTRQVSSLASAEAAAQKKWIGVHFSKYYMSNKTIRQFAAEWIDAQESESKKRVYVNKTDGDVYESEVESKSASDWERIIVSRRSDNDPEFYTRGQVPAGVRFLTAGQDSRSTELHWVVWGHGLLPSELVLPSGVNQKVLCHWLIDYGVVKRPYSLSLDASELGVFDQLIYDRAFTSVDGQHNFFVQQGLHDSGWQPTAVYQYARRRGYRAYPSKGASVRGEVDVEWNAAPIRWGAAPAYRIGEEEVRDKRLKICHLNTFQLKSDFLNSIGRTFLRVRPNGRPSTVQQKIVLPRDVCPDFISQSAAEYLVLEGKKRVWKRRGPNHFCDCNINAYAAALDLDPWQNEMSFEEAQVVESANEEKLKSETYVPSEDGDGDDPLMS